MYSLYNKIRLLKQNTGTLFLLCIIIFFRPSLEAKQAPNESGTSDPLGVDIVPKSPNAFALEKYGNIPVNLNRGLANVEVPIGTLSGRSINIPISLSYHGGGIKVSEEASSVGLGWTLMAGGMITRSVNGLPDEDPNGYNNFANVEGQMQDIPQTIQDAHGLYIPPTEKNYFFEKVLDPLKLADSQPDIFSFNFMGYSGKFVMKENQVYLLPQQPIKVEFVSSDGFTSLSVNNGGYFLITTPDGNKFYFEDKEITEMGQTSPLSEQQYVSGWNLTKIVTANSLETVNFIYTPENLTTTSYSTTTNVNFGVGRVNGIPSGQASLNVTHSSLPSTVNITQNRITSITTDLMKVDFELGNSARVDLNANNAYALENIKFYLKSNGIFNLNRTQKLSYSYFNDASTNDIQLHKRLKLTQVQEFNANNENKPAFTFEYNENLPKKDGATDYWGFYNGKSNGIGIPQFVYDEEGIDYTGADRQPDILSTKAGILTKINYPTGGYTSFDYEANTYSLSSPEYPWTPDTKLAFAENTSGSDVFPMVSDSKDFEVQEQKLITFTVDMEAPHSFPDIKPRVYLYKIEDGQIVGEALKTIVSLGSGPNPPVDHHSTFKFDLHPGTYRIVAETGIRNSTCKISTDGTGSYDYSQPIFSKTGPGLRIKSLTTHDGIDQANDIVKNYSYVNDKNISSGNYAHANERFVSTVKQVYYSYQPDPANHPYLFACGGQGDFIYSLSSNPSRKTPFFVGLRYQQVAEKQTGNGKTVSHFYLNSKSQSDGKLLKQEAFRYNTATDDYTLLKLTENNYSLGNNSTYLLSMLIEKTLDNQCYNDYPTNNGVDGCNYNVYGGNTYKLNHYYLYSEWDFLQSSKETSYDENGNLFTISTSYEYDEKHLQLKKVSKQNSDGSIVSTYNLYPQDYLFDSCEAVLSECQAEVEQCKTAWQNCYAYRYGCYKECPPPSSQNCENMIENNGMVFCADGLLPKIDLCDQTYACDNDYKNCINDLNCNQEYANCRDTAIANADADMQVIALMQDRQMVSNVIETYTTYQAANSTAEITLSAKLIKFKTFASQIQPGEVYLINTQSGLTDFMASYKDVSNNFIKDSRYEIAGTFSNYDNKGNLLEHFKTDDIHSSYLWGHERSLPVAQIVNAENTQVYYEGFEETGTADNEAITGEKVYAGSSYTISASISGNYLMMSYWFFNGANWEFSGEIPFNANIQTSGSKIDEIRVYPKGAFMTTYTYNDEKTITSVCDPNNVISYYEYDSFQRLEYIKDADGNILKKFEYQYGQ